MKIAIILTCFLSLVCFGFAKPKKDAPYIPLYPSEPLHIQVIDNLTMSDVGRNDRFRRIKNTLEEVLEEIDFPLDYRIARMTARKTPADEPRLDIYIMKWGDNGMSQIEVRFSATIRRDYDRNKLGVFYKRGGFAFGSSEQMIRGYNDVLRQALVEVASELNERLGAGILEEAEGDEQAEEDDVSESE
ncbi:hypothetical protein VDG1235_4835 [Verrucomicrobiia bacterium DG1235]|nr:hypothetical protein VDG1235_4835 [Verrucomicrobiae bacterium DG1235]